MLLGLRCNYMLQVVFTVKGFNRRHKLMCADNSRVGESKRIIISSVILIN